MDSFQLSGLQPRLKEVWSSLQVGLKIPGSVQKLIQELAHCIGDRP